ncbi:hypothetical protein J6590_065345, partial [Homalodisca vitripennis]
VNPAEGGMRDCQCPLLSLLHKRPVGCSNRSGTVRFKVVCSMNSSCSNFDILVVNLITFSHSPLTSSKSGAVAVVILMCWYQLNIKEKQEESTKYRKMAK